MAMYKKTIVAGPLVLESIYPAPNPRDPRQVRAEKQKLSSAALSRMNQKYAYQKLELLLAANFGQRDIWAVLTYDDAHLPVSRKEAAKCMQAFVRALRAKRKASGQELRYLYNTEHKHYADDPEQCARLHHHIFINATGDDLEDLQQAWPYGRVLFKTFQLDREHTYESAARYMVKESRDYLGNRLWSCSRNLKKPEVDRVSVHNSADLRIPKKAVVYSDTESSTWYGRYRHVKYLLPCEVRKAPKAKRRHQRPANRQNQQKVRLNRRI